MPAIKHFFLCRRARLSCLCFNLHDDKSLRESCLTQNKRKFPLVRDDSVLARLPTSRHKRQCTQRRHFLCRKIFTESCLTCIMLAQETSISNGCRWRKKSIRKGKLLLTHFPLQLRHCRRILHHHGDALKSRRGRRRGKKSPEMKTFIDCVDSSLAKLFRKQSKAE